MDKPGKFQNEYVRDGHLEALQDDYRQSSIKTAAEAASLFGQSAFKSGIESPLRSLTQLMNRITGSPVAGDTFSAREELAPTTFGPINWLAQQSGATVGMMLPFMAVSLAGRTGVKCLSRAAQVGRGGAPLAESVRVLSLNSKKVIESAGTGMLYDFLCTPVDAAHNDSFWSQRAKNAFTGAATFGVQSALSLSVTGNAAIGPLGKTKGALADEICKHAFAGAVAGGVNAQSRSLLDLGRSADAAELGQSAFTFGLLSALLHAKSELIGRRPTPQEKLIEQPNATESGHNAVRHPDTAVESGTNVTSTNDHHLGDLTTAARIGVRLCSDLSGLDLTESDFSRGDLRGSKLKGCTVAQTTFAGANLRGVDLSGSAGYMPIFTDAELTGATLRETDLQISNFVRTNMDNANCNSARLRFALFQGSSAIHADFSGAHLDRAYFRSSSFRNANFTDAHLVDCAIGEVDFAGANFRDANLDQSRFAGVNADSADFTGAQLLQVDAGRVPSSFRSAVFENANLTEANFNHADLRSARFQGANIDGCSFLHANLDGAEGLNPRVKRFWSHRSGAPESRDSSVATEDALVASIIEQPTVELNWLSYADFLEEQQRSQIAERIRAQVKQETPAQLIHAGRFAELSGISIPEGKNNEMSGLDLAYSDLKLSSLPGSNFSETNFFASDLRGANLRRSTLDGASFGYASMMGCDLSETGSLGDTSFEWSDLRGAQFLSACLAGPRFLHADLSSANFTGSRLRGLEVWNSSARSSQFLACDLEEAGFYESELQDSDFQGSNLRGAKFRCALTNANFAHSQLERTVMARVAAASTNFFGTSIVRSNLVDSDFRGADFRGANLYGVHFSNSDLRGANFSGAQIRNCRFDGAKLDPEVMNLINEAY